MFNVKMYNCRKPSEKRLRKKASKTSRHRVWAPDVHRGLDGLNMSEIVPDSAITLV